MISLRSKTTQAILGYFLLQEDKELYVNEMARHLHLEGGNLSRKLIELEKEGLLKSQWRGPQRYYCLNHQFPFLKEYKKILRSQIGLEPLLKNFLKRLKGVQKAFLFGSYAADRMDSLSDIDLVVVGDHSTIELHKIMSQIQKSLDREINIMSLTPQEYRARSKKDPFLRAVHQKQKIALI